MDLFDPLERVDHSILSDFRQSPPHSPELQEYMEDYVKQVIPKGRIIYRFFDIYDIEEKRM